MLNRLRDALTSAGMPELPSSPTALLADYGLDSLIMVLSIIEFEKTFAIKIPAKDFKPEAFTTLSSLELFLKERGAK
jgi:acyl carrier protein